MDELFKFGEDIWITDKPILPHTDNTAEGMLTYGYILINTGYVLIYDKQEIQIPTGSFYQIDGRKEHETRGKGILAILIWDMPDWTLEDFKLELSRDPRFSRDILSEHSLRSSEVNPPTPYCPHGNAFLA